MSNSRELLTKAVQDAHPQVRLEAVRALSFSPLEDSERQLAEGSAFGEANPAGAKVVAEYREPTLVETTLLPLRQPLDPFIDYAMWLTTRELAPYWRAAFERGEMNFNNDADQIAFAFSALGSGAPVEFLMKDLYADHVTTTKRHRLVELICSAADNNQLGRLFALAAHAEDAATIQAILIVSQVKKIVPPVNVDELTSLLAAEDPILRHSALQAIGQWKVAALRPRLESLIENKSADVGDLAAAFSGIALSDDDDLLQRLEEAGRGEDLGRASESSMEIRSLALQQLAAVRPVTAAPLVVEFMSVLPEGVSATGVARALLSEKDGAALLTEALHGQTLRTDVARDVLRVLRESGRTNANLENALRAAGRITSRKALTEQERKALLERVSTTASAADGERIYRNEQLGCLKCHAIGGAGGLVGPDMISLGASAQPDYLLESLLDPNAKVKENYHTTVIATVDGRVLAGVQIQKSEKSSTLRTAENKVVEVPVDQIEEQSQGVSLMPEGLVDALTDDEIASLVRFLSELGRTPEYTLSKSRLVRSWQVVVPTADAYTQLNRTSFSQVAANNPAFVWNPRYATVAGSLPLEAIPSFRIRDADVGFARCDINVTSPGKIVFRLNSAAGLEVRVDGVPMESAVEFVPDLQAGIHTVTITVEFSKRTETLRLELVDRKDSGNAELINR